MELTTVLVTVSTFGSSLFNLCIFPTTYLKIHPPTVGEKTNGHDVRSGHNVYTQTLAVKYGGV